MLYTTRTVEIFERSYREDRQSFEFATDGGWMDTVFMPNIGRYLIANIQSLRPRQGIGKLLLQESIEHAQALRADYITAYIISRECLDDMTAVFGDENVQVDYVGKYSRDIRYQSDTTSAELHYSL